MNSSKHPAVDTHGDNLEGILRAFFQAEMPHPWPPFCWPLAQTSWGRLLKRWFSPSRLALAASVALLLLGHLVLSSSLSSPPAPDPGLNGPTRAGARGPGVPTSTHRFLR